MVVVMAGVVATLPGRPELVFTAVVLAGLSIIVNFVWLPYYPLWGILVIALDVVVIWAVSTWDGKRI